MTETNESVAANLIEFTADIVSAYVSNNTLPPAELTALIGDVHKALVGAAAPQPPEEPLKPAVPIRRSITPDYIVCLEDGKKFKSLKRHLRVHYDMSPQEYRAKWRLPADYPMVAPNYSAARSALAKKMGLGQVRKGRTKSAPARAAKHTPARKAVGKRG